jgi:hypothetical protein
MPKARLIFDRYWSLAAALILPVVEFPSEGIFRPFMDYEVVRAALALVCIALLVHSWFRQRKYAKSKLRLAFFTLMLTLVALGPVWLGLNVMRAHYYPLNWDDHEVAVWSNICSIQYRVEQLARVLGIAVTLWVIVDSVRWLAKRVHARE